MPRSRLSRRVKPLQSFFMLGYALLFGVVVETLQLEMEVFSLSRLYVVDFFHSITFPLYPFVGFFVAFSTLALGYFSMKYSNFVLKHL